MKLIHTIALSGALLAVGCQPVNKPSNTELLIDEDGTTRTQYYGAGLSCKAKDTSKNLRAYYGVRGDINRNGRNTVSVRLFGDELKEKFGTLVYNQLTQRNETSAALGERNVRISLRDQINTFYSLKLTLPEGEIANSQVDAVLSVANTPLQFDESYEMSCGLLIHSREVARPTLNRETLANFPENARAAILGQIAEDYAYNVDRFADDFWGEELPLDTADLFDLAEAGRAAELADAGELPDGIQTIANQKLAQVEAEALECSEDIAGNLDEGDDTLAIILENGWGCYAKVSVVFDENNNVLGLVGNLYNSGGTDDYDDDYEYSEFIDHTGAVFFDAEYSN